MFWRDGSLGLPSRRSACRASASAACLLAGILATAAPAAAQARPADGKSQIARDLFERGKEKWTAGQYEEAVSLLAASNQQLPRAGTLMLLADAYERLGRLRTARDTFRLASQLARDAGDSQLEYRANTREAALLPRVPRIEVRIVAPIPRGLLVTLNGHELPPEELNTATALDAGAYHLEARAPGYKPFSLQFTVANDAAQQLRARVIPVHLTRGGETDADSSTDSSMFGEGDGRRELAWWVGGAGAAVVVVSAASMIVALVKDGASKDECGRKGPAFVPDENVCSGRGVDLRNQARTFANIATVGGAIGLVGVGAGLTLYFTAGAEGEADSAGVRWQTAF